ncbi:MAG: hypothetical protein HUU29_13655 [Planctomycetaceae bacterium]|nr:hypothetical protein [Planctomycetaceae bacterium]
MADDVHTKYYQGLSQEEKMLVILRDELYDGSWDKMTRDLKDRLTGKPYIFKLVHRIEEDLARIEKLQSYETKYKVNLADYAEGEEA